MSDAAILLSFLRGLSDADARIFFQCRCDLRLARLEEALRRGAVSCYARDGVYPPTLEDLLRRSGVLLDETRYAVDYQIFAENLMPEITVLERGDLG